MKIDNSQWSFLYDETQNANTGTQHMDNYVSRINQEMLVSAGHSDPPQIDFCTRKLQQPVTP